MLSEIRLNSRYHCLPTWNRSEQSRFCKRDVMLHGSTTKDTTQFAGLSAGYRIVGIRGHEQDWVAKFRLLGVQGLGFR